MRFPAEMYYKNVKQRPIDYACRIKYDTLHCLSCVLLQNWKEMLPLFIYCHLPATDLLPASAMGNSEVTLIKDISFLHHSVMPGMAAVFTQA